MFHHKVCGLRIRRITLIFITHLVSFVIIREGHKVIDSLKQELNRLVVQKIGKFALPEKIIFTPDLPKTRSGKIMRRVLRKIAKVNTSFNFTNFFIGNI